MSSEEFRRITMMKEMQKRMRATREEYVKIGATDLWHLEHIERLLVDMLAEPGAKNFHEMAYSLTLHLRFFWAEYAQLKGVPTDLPDTQALS